MEPSLPRFRIGVPHQGPRFEAICQPVIESRIYRWSRSIQGRVRLSYAIAHTDQEIDEEKAIMKAIKSDTNLRIVTSFGSGADLDYDIVGAT